MSPGEYLAAAALGFTILCNLCALVWGAARISVIIKGLERSVGRLDNTMEQIGEVLSNLDKRVTVLEVMNKPPSPMRSAGL